MSVAVGTAGTPAVDVNQRVAEIQRMLSALQPAPPAAPAASGQGGQSFAQVLSSQTAPGTAPSAGASAPVAGGSLGGGAPSQYDGLISAAAQRHGIDPALLKGLIRAESNFNPKAGSPAGAQGLTQLMPGTARSLGVTDPFDPAQSIEGGAKYLKQMLDKFDGDQRLALAAYNAGPGAVARFGGVPPYAETQAYVKKVAAYADEFRGAGGVGAAPSAGTPAASPSPVATPPVPASAISSGPTAGGATIL